MNLAERVGFETPEHFKSRLILKTGRGANHFASAASYSKARRPGSVESQPCRLTTRRLVVRSMQRSRLKRWGTFGPSTPVYCPLPPKVAQALKEQANDRHEYFFWDGKSEREGKRP